MDEGESLIVTDIDVQLELGPAARASAAAAAAASSPDGASGSLRPGSAERRGDLGRTRSVSILKSSNGEGPGLAPMPTGNKHNQSTAQHKHTTGRSRALSFADEHMVVAASGGGGGRGRRRSKEVVARPLEEVKVYRVDPKEKSAAARAEEHERCLTVAWWALIVCALVVWWYFTLLGDQPGPTDGTRRRLRR